jgi:hypothetical protein
MDIGRVEGGIEPEEGNLNDPDTVGVDEEMYD